MNVIVLHLVGPVYGWSCCGCLLGGLEKSNFYDTDMVDVSK